MSTWEKISARPPLAGVLPELCQHCGDYPPICLATITYKDGTAGERVALCDECLTILLVGAGPGERVTEER